MRSAKASNSLKITAFDPRKITRSSSFLAAFEGPAAARDVFASCEDGSRAVWPFI
ncbi:hypothetical protein SAMN05444166_7748 [Singulisphaera sp. GP187]|nr:hypothetical protein SAMN05444166_7748 [Singulisphaera sp. GP187]